MRGRYVCLRPVEDKNAREKEDDADEKVEGFGVREGCVERTGQIASPVPVARRLLLQGWQQHKTLCAMTLDMREAPMPVVCAFLLCPSPFQRFRGYLSHC
jgi:hypothetical protein